MLQIYRCLHLPPVLPPIKTLSICEHTEILNYLLCVASKETFFQIVINPNLPPISPPLKDTFISFKHGYLNLPPMLPPIKKLFYL